MCRVLIGLLTCLTLLVAMSSDESAGATSLIRTLIRQRASLKGKITVSLGKLSDDSSPATISSCKEFITNQLVKISKLDDEINANYEKLSDDPDVISDEHMKELENQTNYLIATETRLREYSQPERGANCTAGKLDLKLPNLSCPNFSGESQAATEYSAFITQFQNVVGLRTNLSDSIKFTYLRSYLRGYAFKVISHLAVTDANYNVALDILEREFLNKEFIIDELFAKLLSFKPKSNVYVDLKIYISEIRCILSDLTVHNVDLLRDSSSAKFVSHIVFSKLSKDFQQELVRKLDQGYPSFANIEKNYVEVIRTLELKNKPQQSEVKSSYNVQLPSKMPSIFKTNTNSSNIKFNSNVAGKPCKFCNVSGHTMRSCKKYCTYDSRVLRCKELNLCHLCSSSRHLADACPDNLDYKCNDCSSNKHISALCSKTQTSLNVCLNSCQAKSCNDYLLPTLTITVFYGAKQSKVRCLVDTGSQRSYISTKALNRINYPNCRNNHEFLISTFLESSTRMYSEASLAVNFGSGDCNQQIPFLLDDKFKLSFAVPSLPKAINNLQSLGNLADTSFRNCNSNDIVLEGLLGIDSLQNFKFNSINVMNGHAFQVSKGVIPYGAIDNFLTDKDLRVKYAAKPYVPEEPEISESVVSCALQPSGTYFDPVAAIYPDSAVESHLDNFFSIESVGISEKEKAGDEKVVTNFERGISFEEGKYHVQLPWIPGKIEKVQSNFNYAKAILNRVVESLTARQLRTAYNDIFEEQLADGTLEEIDLSTINPNNHIWIPHRAVVKTDPAVTTKVRPVLNCSFKVGDNLSLNDAAYKGVDLVNNLLELLLKIRSNMFLVVSDIRKAFLQIKLSSEVDKNRFSILWVNPDGSLRAFRYTTIVFGYIASPFILQCVMQYHLRKLPQNETRDMLLTNYYVDNLFFSGNNFTELEKLYRESFDIMNSGGFTLRSWFTNHCNLQAAFQADCRSTEHSTAEEKILGYRYAVPEDKLHLSDVLISDLSEVNSKRSFLSCFAKYFDPLGLAIPVLVTGKLLLREMWLSKIGWDSPLPVEIKSRCDKFLKDATLLSQFKFDRKCYLDKEKVAITVFCDASKEAYGFAVYVTSHDTNESNLLFAKVKTAPLQKKSMPTLELLSVFLAFKCLGQLLKSLTCSLISLTLAVDAQVVLAWLLTGNIKAKNQFAKNRLNDIYDLKASITKEFDITPQFIHIGTDYNVADYLTKGLTCKSFSSRFVTWNKGPDFLCKPITEWPKSNLGCLPNLDSGLTCATVSSASTDSDTIFSVSQYSSLNKLLKVTSLVIKFIKLLRKQPVDTASLRGEASRYWLQKEQQKFLNAEVDFLNKSQVTTPVPTLVRDLNLFLDKHGLVRAKGRLSKCNNVPYHIQNPVLLPRNSFLSELYVRNFHLQCKHLGVSSTLNTLRTHGFWLPRGRATVKRMLSTCYVCKKLNSLSFRYPKRTDFIGDRVNFTHPFDHTGIDHTGSFNVAIGNEICKMYLVIFTCLNIRAVHIELVPSLSVQHFLLAFIKFVNAHCHPSVIYTDNASNFVSAGKMLGSTKFDNPFTEYLEQNNVKHHKIPAYSAWVGAAWERLIRTVKLAIHKSVGRARLEYFGFVSLLSEIQCAINSRPLTYRDSDINNLDILTPNSFLNVNNYRHLNFGELDGSELQIATRTELLKTFTKREDLLDNLLTLWHDSYLLSLRETSKDMYDRYWEECISIGDIVLIAVPNRPRVWWQMGRVIELLTGTDGKTRCVKLKTPTGEGVYSTCLLYPLEISLQDVAARNPSPTIPQGKNSGAQAAHPTRAAAQRCKDRLRVCN